MTGRVLLFWFLLCTIGVSPDPVTININISCKPGLFWCGKLLIYEEDSKYTHDEWYTDSFCTNTSIQRYLLEPFYPGGDWSPSYEVGLQFTHNCSMDGLTRCYEPGIRDVSVIGSVVVDFNITIFKKGIERECIHPNANPFLSD